MLTKKPLNPEQLENVNGGSGDDIQWSYSFEYDFSPDFADPQLVTGSGFASETDAKAALCAESERLSAQYSVRRFCQLYFRNETIKSYSSSGVLIDY